MAAREHKLLFVQDALLTQMANDTRFLKEFPFLRTLKAAVKKGCGTCGSSNKKRAQTFTSVKQQLAGMSGDKKLKLKKMLNARQIRMIYRMPNNKTRQLTF